MTGRQLTAFEHILLGLISTAPASGYDLKRIFAATPMGIYQPSSGTLHTGRWRGV
jgi:DNA-binding PadR family transcriptional regulator